MLFGLLDLPWWGYVIFTLVATHITIVSVTLYLHRSQAHRSCDFHPIISHFFRFWLWLTTGMVTKQFVGVHRKHHAYSDIPGDPHSPVVEGVYKVLWEGVELYRAGAANKSEIEKYSHGTPNDWIERNLYTPFSAKGVLLMLLIDIVLLGLPGVTVWAIQMMWIPFMATGVINGLAHHWGYRNFECPDASTNIFPIGILIGGEELHNNHHTFGTSAKLSLKWWELDIGWQYLKLLRLFKLATIRRLPPEMDVQPGKCTIDVDTIKAVFNNRFQVLGQYTKEVILPIFNEEKCKMTGVGKTCIAKAKAALIRERSLVDESGKQTMETLFGSSEKLAKVYQLRLSLQDIWEKTALSQKELVEALQNWCREAEATGIEAVTQFVTQMKSYTPPKKQLSA